MPNMDRIIKGHNRKLLKNNTQFATAEEDLQIVQLEGNVGKNQSFIKQQ